MTIDKELARVLSNPENVIMSNELEGLISETGTNTQSEEAVLRVGKKIHHCSVVEAEIDSSKVKFTLAGKSSLFSDLLINHDLLIVEIDENKFVQNPDSSIIWKKDEGNFLTLTTRRILNEAV